jgi:hypothetical protein
MKNLESKLQQQCVKWFKYQYPKETIFAIPNGSQRNIITAKILKGEGVLAGVSDLMILGSKVVQDGIDMNVWCGMFIEMKSEKGKLSDSQKAFIENATEKGYYCAVCNSFESFVKEVKNYLD